MRPAGRTKQKTSAGIYISSGEGFTFLASRLTPFELKTEQNLL
jgi:hypothetical protein